MDPETGAAGYMIGGGLAGGSVALDIEVTLVGLAVLTWAILDTIAIASAFITATNPLISVVFFALAVISTITIAMTLQDILMYWQTGDYKYASQLMGDLLLNLACFGLFKVLEAVLPGIMAIFKSVKNQMDEVAQAAKLIGDDLAEAIARVSGPDALPRAAELLKKLDDIGIDPNFSRNIANKAGIEGLETAAEVITKYGDDAARAINNYGEDALRLINRYGEEAVKAITNYGGDAVRAIKKHQYDALRAINQYGSEAVEVITKYGDDAVRNITKHGEDGVIAFYVYGDELVENIAKYGDEAVETVLKHGDNAIIAMKNGIEPSLINRLDDLGIKPADFERLRITSREAAETVAEAIETAITSAKATQRASGYLEDVFTGRILLKGTKIYGGLPGQTSWYTNLFSVEASGLSRSKLFQGIQVQPHPEFGYRPQIGVYELLEDVTVAEGKALANIQYGAGGYHQYFLEQYSGKLILVETINLGN
jgi:hypothetical protein